MRQHPIGQSHSSTSARGRIKPAQVIENNERETVLNITVTWNIMNIHMQWSTSDAFVDWWMTTECLLKIQFSNCCTILRSASLELNARWYANSRSTKARPTNSTSAYVAVTEPSPTTYLGSRLNTQQYCTAKNIASCQIISTRSAFVPRAIAHVLTPSSTGARL